MKSHTWYLHRLRAMDRGEVGGRIKDKLRSLLDRAIGRDWKAVPLAAQSSFPSIPSAATVPAELTTEIEKEVAAILKRQWTMFRGLPVLVDDPPRWQFDYLVRQDLQTK